MKTKQNIRSIAVMIIAIALHLVLAMPVMATTGEASEEVLDAQNGVVRIMITAEDGVGVGTGFAVGEEGNIYIVTNHHVIADAEEITILYATGRGVSATIVEDDEMRDICILKPDERIPGIASLSLRTEEVTVGMSAFALGFPAVADGVTGDLERFLAGEADLPAGKENMTFTSGMIGAIRDNYNVGDGSGIVKTIQTNTSISGGNSGGPLLDKNGDVIGVNTMGASTGDQVFFSVHVKELISVLDKAGIKYATDAEEIVQEPVTTKPQNTTTTIILLASGVALLGAIAIIVVALRGKNSGQQQSAAAPQYNNGYYQAQGQQPQAGHQVQAYQQPQQPQQVYNGYQQQVQANAQPTQPQYSQPQQQGYVAPAPQQGQTYQSGYTQQEAAQPATQQPNPNTQAYPATQNNANQGYYNQQGGWNQ